MINIGGRAPTSRNLIIKSKPYGGKNKTTFVFPENDSMLVLEALADVVVGFSMTTVSCKEYVPPEKVLEDVWKVIAMRYKQEVADGN